VGSPQERPHSPHRPGSGSPVLARTLSRLLALLPD
jgi:hypothetical protein